MARIAASFFGSTGSGGSSDAADLRVGGVFAVAVHLWPHFTGPSTALPYGSSSSLLALNRCPLSGSHGPSHPKSVALARAEPRQVHVVDEVVGLGHLHSRLHAVAVEQAQFDACGAFGVEREVGAAAVVGGALRERRARPHLALAGSRSRRRNLRRRHRTSHHTGDAGRAQIRDDPVDTGSRSAVAAERRVGEWVRGEGSLTASLTGCNSTDHYRPKRGAAGRPGPGDRRRTSPRGVPGPVVAGEVTRNSVTRYAPSAWA